MARHVIVTGGSRGLGLALVEGLLEDGYRVSTCSRSATEEVERLAQDPRYVGRFLWLPCSVGKADEVDRFVQQSVSWAAQDGVFGLINCAGVAADGVLATFPHVGIAQILEVNLLGPLQVTRAVLRVQLRTRHGGRIINVSSIVGSRGYSGLAVYSASKAGLDGMTRALAREVGRLGITVNSIAPGYLPTGMSSSLNEQQLEQIIRRTPLGRLCTTEDILAVVRFLLGDSASFITGQTILVDGGMSC